jgi:hypothetical protein
MQCVFSEKRNSSNEISTRVGATWKLPFDWDEEACKEQSEGDLSLRASKCSYLRSPELGWQGSATYTLLSSSKL